MNRLGPKAPGGSVFSHKFHHKGTKTTHHRDTETQRTNPQMTRIPQIYQIGYETFSGRGGFQTRPCTTEARQAYRQNGSRTAHTQKSHPVLMRRDVTPKNVWRKEPGREGCMKQELPIPNSATRATSRQPERAVESATLGSSHDREAKSQTPPR